MLTLFRAFNFPFQLSLGPMIGAISGGNTVILKPSEASPNCAAVMQKIIEEYLDPDCYQVVQGGIPETTALLAEKWDKIFFTGSVNTARVVAKAAAVNLTPVALELGGKNPAIVTRKADIRLAARRLLWGKTMNAGQVCISQNYTMVDKEVFPEFITQMKAAMKEFFPNGTKDNPDYGHIVNRKSFDRLKKMLDNTSGKIVAGGTMDADQLFIEPTLVEVSDINDSLLVEESFGPLMPVLPVDNLDQAISIANQIHETPLGVYAFGSKEETNKVLAETRSGGASINDAFFHGTIPTLSFGGTGDSGSGAYRGRASFDSFVHRRSITTTPGWMERLLAVRYPPFTGTDKYEQFARMGVQKPNFDRSGKENFNLLWYVVTFGTKRGMLSALIYIALAVGGKFLMERRVR
jgi:beta-apo-4'-carotenal oxygenase